MNLQGEETITDVELDIALGNVVVAPAGGSTNNNNDDDGVEILSYYDDNVNDDDGDVNISTISTSNHIADEEELSNLDNAAAAADDDDDDFYTRTLKRLQNQDPTLQSLEVCNLMEWGLLRDYRHHEEEGDGDGNNGYLDVLSWFSSLSNLLRQAKYSPYVTQLDLTNLLLDYPLLSSSVQDLLLSSNCCSNTDNTSTTAAAACNEGNNRNENSTTTTTTANRSRSHNITTNTTSRSNDSHHHHHHHLSRRSWKKLSIDDCMGVEPQLVNMLHHVELSTLHISNNHLNEQSMVALGELLTHNKSICRVRISEHFTFEAGKSLANALIVNTTLHELDLLGSTFDAGNDGDDSSSSSSSSSIAIRELAKGIDQNYGIRILSLGYCQLNDTNLSILIRAITHHQTLTWLDLSNNCFGTNSCDALEEVLLLHDQCVLEEDYRNTLSSSSSSSSSTDVDATASAPAATTKNNDSLSHLAGLSLVHTGIDDKKAIRIIGALAKASAPACTTPITTTASSSSSNVINNPIRIKHLHLSENKITDYGIQMLAADHLLPKLHHLESLYLSENDFGDAGAETLLDLTKKCCDHLLDVVVDRHLRYFDDIQYQILLNRGGHGKALKDDTISLALWPLVLERCHHVKHCCRKAGPADIIYHILKGGAGPLCHDVR